MKAVAGSWNIPASWNIVSVNVPQIAGYTVDTSGGSENVNHVPANKFVYPTFDQNVFTEAETVYEAKPEHTIVYHEIPNFTVNVVDDATGQVIGTTGKLVNPGNGSYTTMQWHDGLDQHNWNYRVVKVTGVPNGFTLAGNYFHALNDQASFTDLTYPNYRWTNGTDFKGAVMVIHVVPAMVTVNYRFMDTSGRIVGSGKLATLPGASLSTEQVNVPAGWVLVNGQLAGLSQKLQQASAGDNTNVDFLVTHHLVWVTADQTFKASDLVPGTQDKYGIDSFALKHVVHRTIVLKDVNGKVIDTVVQTATFKRSAVIDLATGLAQYEAWHGSGFLTAYQPSVVAGMEALPVVKSQVVRPDSNDQTLTLQYRKAIPTALINYVDINGKVVSQAKVTGEVAQLVAPAGYHLALASDRLALIASRQSYNVLVTPKVETGIKDGHQFRQPLTKTVFRTIVIHQANRRVRRIFQRVRFTRDAMLTKDGREIYGVWQATGRAQFSKVFLAKRAGYHLVITNAAGQHLTGVDKVSRVDGKMNDTVINVKYVKNN